MKQKWFIGIDVGGSKTTVLVRTEEGVEKLDAAKSGNMHNIGIERTLENIKTPIENLFLIGDSVKAKGIGFNCALNSACKLIEILEKDKILT